MDGKVKICYNEKMPVNQEKSALSLSVLMPVYNEVYTVAGCLEKVLAVKSPHISGLEIIIVDDGSLDGTRDILRSFKERHPGQIVYIEHEKNRGKGAAIRTAIARASHDICIIQDADLEYNPNDYGKIMVPFVEENADAVFGSRFLAGDYTRLLYYRHAVINRFLTFLTNLITDINYTDMETCYKAVRTRLLKSIPLRSNGFDLEPEIAVKLAKRGAHIFEVPISYSGRTVEEGKKIGWKDGVRAFWTLLKFWLIDDLYRKDEYGSHILSGMSGSPNFSRWMADEIRPFIGKRVLEIGAGIGNLTRFLIPRLEYTVSDINPNYLDYLINYCKNKPYLDVKKIDLSRADDFSPVKGRFDTVICINVLEHLQDGLAALKNISTALAQGGRAIILVPQGQGLYSSLDAALDHQKRYAAQELESIMKQAGFEVERTITTFNKIGVISWIINGKILKRKRFSKLQLKLLNVMSWLFRTVNPALPWNGLSVICVGRKS